MSDSHPPPVPPPVEPLLQADPPADTPAARLVATLAFSGALAGLLIVMAFQWAQPKIVAHQAALMAGAVQEVLAAPATTERLFVYQDRLVPELPAGVDSAGIDRVFVGYDAAGKRVGYAILGGEPGFADVISLIFGYDPATDRVIGMKVLDNKETPGLGDKIVKDTMFVAGFGGVEAPLQGVKAGAGKGTANEVALITGATISSRVVVGIVNHRIEAVKPLIERYQKEVAP